MIIVIFGPPGCGKGTQSQLISRKYGLKHVSTGDMLRSEIDEQTDFGRTVQAFIAEGKLVPDEVIIGMLMKNFGNTDPNFRGVILDGFPRTIAQADALESNLRCRGRNTDLLIDLQVETQELFNRLLYRGQLSGRIDDNPDTIRQRLQVYEEKTAPVRDYYKEQGKYAYIDGMGEIEDVFKKICDEINHLSPTDS